MSEETPTPQAQNTAQEGPQLRLLTQYIKDLSFENPNAPASLQNNNAAPAIDMEIGVGTRPAQEGIHEVTITISIKAARAEEPVFLIELVYCGLFAINGVPEESLGAVLNIECTRLIFPFARRIISDLTQDGGFPALPLDPIDFVAVYRANLEQQAAQKAAATQTNGSESTTTEA